MRFSICVLFFVISLTLLEAVPSPQLTTIKRQPWKPKAIREKEAAKAAEEAARAAEEEARKAEEAARAAEEATEVPEQTTEIIEQTTSLEEETLLTTEQVVPVETTTLVIETTTIPDETSGEDVTQALLTTVTDNPSPVTNEVQLEISTLPVPIEMQDNLVTNLTPNKRRIVTSRKLTKFTFSAKGRTPALTKKGVQSAEAASCRLSLRGVPCNCRFEGTCRCDCGRRSNNQSTGATRSLSLAN
ncbi:uncharacterized protein LOC130686042 [Daphnia carinata]|uniref:uncharacterized protein LOC130686042 n=1 Tax=Daphnia carinata TaxID=120202 RepID=UPI002580281C|nr:uncharacterized protein LOC130686042 [Daphnia carinata]